MTASNFKEVLDKIVGAYRSLLINLQKQACPVCRKMIVNTIQEASRRLTEEQRLEWVDQDERKTH